MRCVRAFYTIHHHQCVLPESRSFTASPGTQAAVLSVEGLSSQTQEPRLQFYQGLNRGRSFPLLSPHHSLFSIWTDLKTSEQIPRHTTWRWGEWIWLTGPSGLNRNSQQELNISSIGFLTRSGIRKSQSPFATFIWTSLTVSKVPMTFLKEKTR